MNRRKVSETKVFAELARHGLKLAKKDSIYQVQTSDGKRVTEWMSLEEVADWIDDDADDDDGSSWRLTTIATLAGNLKQKQQDEIIRIIWGIYYAGRAGIE